ncbi:MAG: DUF5666 domain-containing protein [Candidatus Rokuibacteriota bacterium]
MKALIAPLVAGMLVIGGLGAAVAQAPAVGQGTDKKTEKADDKADDLAVHTAVGRVKSVAPDRLVVTGRSRGQGAEWTFVLDAKTRIRKAGKDVAAADLKEGDGVQVRYMKHGGKNVAQTVTARGVPPKSEPKPTDKPAEKKP